MSPMSIAVAALSVLAVSVDVRAADPDPRAYEAALARYVVDGRVDYAGLRGDRADLDAYLGSVASASGDLSPAFYVNAYNALVVAALLDSGPFLPKFVTDLRGFFDAKRYRVAGRDMTLNDIHALARKTAKDPRLHFALVPGARSGPPLQSNPFDATTLDATLTRLTSALLDGRWVAVDDAKKELRVPKVMDWYRADFTEGGATLGAFLEKYTTDAGKRAAVARAIANGYTVTFQNYNWAVNVR